MGEDEKTSTTETFPGGRVRMEEVDGRLARFTITLDATISEETPNLDLLFGDLSRRLLEAKEIVRSHVKA